MRPCEVCAMRPIDLDTSGDVWVYELNEHKTVDHVGSKKIFIGPKGKIAIKGHLHGRPVDAPIFSPTEAEKERRAKLREQRKSHPSCNKTRDLNRKARPRDLTGEKYTTDSYRRAIHRACKSAGVPQWSPGRLRHNFATEARKTYGLEAAQVLLGHSSAVITDAVYAERDLRLATEAIKKIG